MANTDDEPEHILYSERPHWADVVPVPQYEEGANPIAPIFYNEAYKDATNYFRAMVKAGELSTRVLEVTETVIRMNPAHYSAWQYRYQALLETRAPLGPEHTLMDEIATKHLKTYQVWHHRRLLLLLAAKRAADPSSPDESAKSISPENELSFIATALRSDEKNYHTWAFRQWVLATFFSPLSTAAPSRMPTPAPLADAKKARAQAEDNAATYRAAVLSDELAFVDVMLQADVRNNSAWHHRFFVVFKLVPDTNVNEEIVQRELSYVREKIALAPNNGSAWNYLRGVLELSNTPFSSLTSFVTPFTRSRSQTVIQDPQKSSSVIDLDCPLPSEGADLPAPAALEFLADIWEREAEIAGSGTIVSEKLHNCVQIWQSLAEEHDTVRKKYWEHRIHVAQLTRA